jgi:iron complex transport system permease protein
MIRKHPFLVITILLVAALMLSIGLGAVRIPAGMVARIIFDHLFGRSGSAGARNATETILLAVRLPHTILMMLTGAALASSGAAYQGLFRNPLSDPYLIGVASGAGLGAVAMMALRGLHGLLGYYLIPLGAFAGAILTVVLVYQLAHVNGMVPLTTLILAGVAFGSFASALTSFLMLRDDGAVYRAIAFLMGGSPISGWEPVLAVLPFMLIGMAALSLSGHVLNLLQFGEEEARQMGLHVDKAKILVIIAASMTTAVAVAFSGVIGYVGLIVPHIIRLVWGPDYKRLIPLAILGGAVTLLLSDVLARVLIAPSTIPVGIVTALAGTPFFLYILRRAKREVFW